MFLLSETDFPEYASLITTFKNWDKRGDADNKGACYIFINL